MSEHPDLSGLIERDHEQIELRFAQYEGGMTAASYDEIVSAVVEGLTRHATAEEQVVYPVVGDVLGDEEAERSLAEHARITELLRRIHRADHDTDTTHDFTELMAEVRHHVPPEEQELLPRLRRELGDERMAELGAAFARAKADAPSAPPGHTVAGTVASVVHRVSDAISNKGRDR